LVWKKRCNRKLKVPTFAGMTDWIHLAIIDGI
jgi:hypothetical protein